MHFPVITPSLSSLFQRIDHGASAMFAFLGHRHHANGASAIPNPTVQPVRVEVNTAQANNASVSGPPSKTVKQNQRDKQFATKQYSPSEARMRLMREHARFDASICYLHTQNNNRRAAGCTIVAFNLLQNW